MRAPGHGLSSRSRPRGRPARPARRLDLDLEMLEPRLHPGSLVWWALGLGLADASLSPDAAAGPALARPGDSAPRRTATPAEPRPSDPTPPRTDTPRLTRLTPPGHHLQTTIVPPAAAAPPSTPSAPVRPWDTAPFTSAEDLLRLFDSPTARRGQAAAGDLPPAAPPAFSSGGNSPGAAPGASLSQPLSALGASDPGSTRPQGESALTSLAGPTGTAPPAGSTMLTLDPTAPPPPAPPAGSVATTPTPSTTAVIPSFVGPLPTPPGPTAATPPAPTPLPAPRSAQQVLGFHGGLQGWDIHVVGGSDAGRGSVTAGSALLREGDSFLVGLQQTFTVPANPAPLVFRYTDLFFDTADPDSINDAFEVSLVGPDGRTLVYAYAPGRDAFFNVTESVGLATGAGTAETGDAIRTVTVDLAGVFPGTQATVRFRLVNNDQDTQTSVRILDVLVPTDNSLPVVTGPGPHTATEGQTLHVQASFTDPNIADTHTALIAWGDGASSTATVTPGPGGTGTVAASHVYADNGAYTAQVTVTDNGGLAGSAPFAVTVSNANPAVAAGLAFEVVPGPTGPRTGVVLGGTFSDPGFTRAAAGTLETLTVSIAWGDGPAETVPATVIPGAEGVPTQGRFTARHVYAQPGLYTPVVTVTDDDTGAGTAAVPLGVARLTVTRTIDVPKGGALPVLVLRDPGFDSTQIDVNTVRFGPANARADNLVMQVRTTDVRFNFTVANLGFHTADTTAVLTGRLKNGTPFGSVSAATVIGGAALPATSPAGATKFFVADAAADAAFRYTTAGAAAGSFPLDGVARDVRGLASNAAGDRVWALDALTHAVTAQRPDGTLLGSWRAEGLQSPQGLTSDGTDLWVVDAALRQVVRYAAAATLTSGEAVPWTRFSLHADNASPTDLVTDGRLLWVTDVARDEVFVYDLAGALQGRWALDPRNSDATGITNDPTGASSDLWVVDRADRLVYRYAAGSAWRDGTRAAAGTFSLAAGNTAPEAIADPPQSGAGDSLLDASGQALFTTTPDFNQGTLFNVNAATVPDELRLDPPGQVETFPFIWVANSGDGTLSKFDTRTGRELGRYRTGPNALGGSLSPSRTAVDGDGNVWVANRAFGLQGSVVKVLLDDFIDRNGNGQVDTSRDVNNDGVISGSEMLPWDVNGDGQPDDERIALAVPAGRNRANPSQLINDAIPRSMALDAHDNLWVGLYNLRQYEVYDAATGALEAIVPVPETPYGAVVDAQGQLWGATLFDNALTHVDTLTRTYVESIPVGGNTYGITLDPDGVVWTVLYSSGQLVRYDPATRTLDRYTVPYGELRGVALDRDRNVWVASTTSDLLHKSIFAADHRTRTGTATVAVPDGPTAAVLDADGFIWTTTRFNNRAYKIDPASTAVVPGWPVATGNDPYNYSDMTGQVRVTVTSRTGSWKEVLDSERADTPWGSVGLAASVPDRTSLRLRVRTANDRALLSGAAWVEVPPGTNPQGLRGRYLEVEVSLASAAADVTPAVRDLAVAAILPPTLTVASPAAGAALDAGQTVVLTGQALAHRPAVFNLPPAANRIQLVTVNGTPVEALDALGRFFTRVPILPGQNSFTVRTLDAYGQTAETTLTVEGVQRPAGAIDFSLLTDITASFRGEYARTSFHTGDALLYTDMVVRNVGQYAIDVPLYVAVRDLSNPTVRVKDPDGVTPDGLPYYDYTARVPGGTLAPDALTDLLPLAFYNPDRTPFTYDLVFFGLINRPPAILTVPDVEAIVGRPYAYDVDAADPDGDPVSFSLVTAPPGMTIDAATGRIAWPSPDLGNHEVTVRAADGRGGTADQVYVLSAIPLPPNRPPVFTSVPVVDAGVSVAYAYTATAADPDDDPLTFTLVSGPDGLTVSPAGQVAWTPSAGQAGLHHVTLQVEDGRGGVATQVFQVRVGQQPGNTPPVIVSEPVIVFDVPRFPNSPQGDVQPTRIDLDLGPGETATRSLSLTLPPVGTGQSFADVVFVVDESGSMAGEHEWLENMVLSLDAALEARGIGPNRYILAGFGGGGAREPGHLFNLLQNSTLSLFGPTGSTALVTQSIAAVLPPVLLESTTATAGTHLLLLSGTAAGSYSFRLLTPGAATLPLVLGSTVADSIDLPGEQDRFTFSLTQPSRLFFDALSSSGSTAWSLTGPAGAAVTNRSFSTSDGAGLAGSPVLNLPPGDYTLTVEAGSGATGPYAFRLSDLATAAPLTPGTPVSGSLDPASETDLYQFTASAGARFFFDLQARTNGAGSVWKLVDPYGNLLFSNPFSSTTAADVDGLTLTQPGTYTLFLDGAGSATAAGAYTVNVQPVSTAAQPLMLGALTSGTLATAGAQARYSFSLPAASLLYFDSLTNSSTLTWTLTGPAGTAVNARAFNSAENSNPVLNLPAGDYTLTVDLPGDQAGPYAFRLSELAAATSLTPGTPVSGSLDPAHETDLYQFTAAAGDRFFFDLVSRTNAGSSRWRLIDPYGNALFTTTFSSTSTSDVDVLTLAQAGPYTLLLEGAIADTTAGAYTVNVQPVSTATQPLTLGALTSGTLATAGAQARWTFSLPAASLLYFDSLTNSSTLTWTLSGPAGTAVNARAFNSAENSNPVLNLPAGDYTLTVDLPGDQAGPFAFRLSELAAATSLTPGTPVSGSLDPAHETDLYQFTAAAGDRFFFDLVSRTNGGNSRWRLIDPHGNVLFNSAFTNTSSLDVDVLTLAQPGSYTLLLEGAIADTTAGAYTVNVQPAGIVPQPLTLGSLTSGMLATAGTQARWTFSLPAASLLYFDSLTNSSTLTWTLSGPAGTAVNARAFNSAENSNPVLNLPAGDYILTVDLPGDQTGPYAFRLSELAAATSLTPGTPVSGSLDPAHETDLYQFTAAAGDRVSFDLQARTNGGSSRWRLIDPYGNALFSTTFTSTSTSDVAATTLAQPGAYTLLLEGAIADTTAGAYTFTVVPQGNVPPTPPPASTPLMLGSSVAATIAAAGEQDRYSFSLPAASLLYFDSLTNSGTLTWTLAGPAGTAVSARAFNSAENSNPVLNLPAGDYTLTVAATGSNTGAYAFRLSELASGPVLTPGTPVSGSLDPANETDLYRFTAAAGDRFYFDLQTRTSGGSSRWRLIDPYGNVLFTTTFNSISSSDVDVLTLAQPGSYTLLLEGAIGDTTAGAYTINVQPAGIVPQPLTLGSLTSGMLATAGAQARYTFSLPAASLLYFDSLTNSSTLTWTLSGPAGTAVNARAFNSAENSNPVLNLPAGDYTLTIELPGDQTGPYAFRLSELASAPVLTPGTPASGSLDPAHETDLYQFTAAAGDRFFFDLVSRTNAGSSRWRLIDPYGNALFTTTFTSISSSDVDVLTLAQAGPYTLLLEGALADTTAGTYTVNVQPAGVTAQPLTLDSLTSGMLATAGAQGRYTFSLPAASLLYFDSLTNSSTLTWTLTGPAGTAVNARAFNSAENSNPVLSLAAGDYTLTIDLPGDQAGPYAFRLSELASAPVLTPGTPASGSLDPANETDLYQFTATAGDRLFFDLQTRTSGGSSRWRLIDPFGNVLFTTTFTSISSSDVDVLTLAQPGSYTLLLEGAIADTTAGAYTVNVQPAGIVPQPLTLGALTSGMLATAGAQARYSFALPAASLLYFDSLTNSGSLTWTLTGPAGTAVNARVFNSTENGNPVLNLPAGDYTLTVDLPGDQAGPYAFRLSELAAATSLTPGTPVSGSLDPANETALYRFTAAAGDRFYFDLQTRTSGGGSRWRLIDPYGNVLFTTTFTNTSTSDVDVLTLAQAGPYTLLLEGALGDTTAGAYTVNVQPVSITTQPLALGSLTSGMLATAGAQARYSFALPAASLLYFDSLTNSGSLTWTLSGPTGTAVNARAFNSAENSNPVLSLAAGDYTLTIDLPGDQAGPYAFRLSELASASALTPGTPVSGSLDPANETDLYQFTAAAGDRLFFDLVSRTNGGGSRWRLIDPYGNVLFTTTFTNTSSSDVDVLTLAQAGPYTLLLEGAIGDTTAGTYTVNVQPAGVTAQPLTLGSLTSGTLATAGAQARWTFSLPAASLLYFDSLTNSSTLTWTLTGPAGTAVNARAFNSAENSNPVLNLPAGDYTLTVDLPGDQTGPYAFRLSELAAATSLTPGTPVSGNLDPAHETDLYQFTAAAGDRFFFDLVSRTNGGSSRWRLIDPYGNVLFTTTFTNTSSSDVDVLTLAQAGPYTLLLEGAIGDTTAGAYTVNVQPVSTATQPLTLGALTSGTVATAGAQARWSFALPAASLLYFDSLTNSGTLTWTLIGPAGTAVNARVFNSAENSNPVLNLPAGDYTLTVDLPGDLTGPYAFRLSELASASALTPGTPVSGSLDPAHETDLYQFTAAAGDRVSFDLQARTNGGSSRWRLIDPYGNALFSTTFTSTSTSDVAATTLAQPGAYTLLLEGAITDTTAGAYTFTVVPQSSISPTPPPPSTPLTLGSPVAATIAAAGEQDRYSFSLPAASLLYFDSLTNSGTLTWTLTGPAGSHVSARAFSSAENGNPVLNLPAGDYTLTVAATGSNTGAYAFRLSELASGPALTPGTPVSGSLDPANETDLYQFTAAAGDRFYFDLQTRTSGGSSRWRLIDPYGNALFTTTFTNTSSSDVDVLTLAQPGSYTLLLEGALGDSTAGAYTVNVQPVSITTQPLTLGSLTSGTLATAGAQARYSFALPAASLLYFDSLTNSGSLTWTLTGPAGTAVNARAFNASLDGSNSGNPVLALPAGDYTLTIDLPGDQAGSYAFRLADLASAVPLTPGTPVSGSLDPAHETDLYRFTAAAGDRFYFDLQARANAGGSRWRLIDPHGNVLFNSAFTNTSSSDVDVLTLAQPGSYTLLLEGAIGDATAGAYTVNVQPVTFAATALVFNQPVSDALAVAGEQDDYTFTGAAGQRVYFDGHGPSATVTARLFSPSGSVVFTAAANANSGPLFLPESGPYRLNFDATGDVTGAYRFQFLDVATLPSLPVNTDTSGAIDPALETDLYRIDVPAGQKLVFLPGAALIAGTALQLSVATRSLETSGGFEDGYHGISAGLGANAFRPGSAINFVLITDEDRDVLDPALTFSSVFTALDSRDALLNGVHDARFRDGANQVALGVDSQGVAYLADGAGGFTTATGGRYFSGEGTTRVDYVDLAWALGGAAWDLEQLRAGGLPAVSFTKAFVEIKAREIEEQLQLHVVASDPNAGFENLTGTLTGVGGGETATFDLRFTGDGTARSYDLLVVRPGTNLVLGSVPVTLGNDYLYLVQARDADGDPITYSLLEAPEGAAVDPHTGRIAWEPSAAGTYRFVVQADDGRGGRDTQEYEVAVTAGAPNQAPVISSAAPTQATAGLPFGRTVTAADPDGDRLAWYLGQAPAGMTLDRTTGRLAWTPTAAQVGSHPVTVRALDGRGGEATQTFTLTVVPDTGNRFPSFVSTPVLGAGVGELYRYEAAATDLDGDALVFDLVIRPDGMTVDPASGGLAWRPAPDQVGQHHVFLRVSDGRGGADVQSFQVTVAPPGSAPVFSTPPPTAPAVVGLPYQYQFAAQDADGDALTFRLDTGPAGMTLDPATGRLAWTPTAAQVPSQHVAVTALDSQGAATTLEFDLAVVASAPNDPPLISSLPRLTASLGQRYLYAVLADDPNGDPLTIHLDIAPAGMTLDAAGLVAWEPASGQVGPNFVRVRVSDGRGGAATQEFTITVAAQGSNRPPTILSTPPLGGTVDRAYAYDIVATDPDGDPLVMQLTSGPQGLSLDPVRGTLRWTPTASQLGPHQVALAVMDAQGGTATQTFTVTVRALNLPPTITSAPPTQANVGQVYVYAPRAIDPDGDRLTFSLAAAPANMGIDSATGLILWTPAAGQVGTQTVTLRVEDGQGGVATQPFSIVVVAAGRDDPPLITSTPPFTATVAEPYTYTVTAADPEGQALTYSLVAGPTGMTLNPSTGAVAWTPTAAQLGTHAVTVAAFDPAGQGSTQSYTLRVLAANRPPQITSAPSTTATVGLTYRYDARAADPDGEPLTYRLDAAPAGMTIDARGRITWPTAGVTPGPYAVTVTVSDPRGGAASQPFTVTLAPDTQAPSVQVLINVNPVRMGSPAVVSVQATDNVAVMGRTLTVAGTPVPLDANGRATLTIPTAGLVALAATATDAAGNVTQATATLLVFDPTDAEAPAVSLQLPDDTVFTALTPVVGTVTDPNLLFYALEVAPVGTGAFREVFRGTTPVTNGLLGTFDPTLLLNDSYTLRLRAQDAGGHETVVERSVSVAGEIKLGNFTLSFEDMRVPVSGVPITVTRTYDTLNAAQGGDVGFGWRLEFREARVRSNVPPSGLEEYDIYNPFQEGTRVYVTLPGGQREGFTFNPTPAPGLAGSFLGIHYPAFVADPGVYSKLTVEQQPLLRAGGRFVAWGASSIPYNPSSSFFGGSYTLTTREGLAYHIDAPSGLVNRVTDRNGNHLEFTADGIVSSAGPRIAFTRDPQGRIIGLTDPAGHTVRYQYDARGDLAAVTDREGHTTRFVYRTDRPHYLEQVIDPLGRTGIRTEYGPDGRLVRLVDAGGQNVALTYDPDHSLTTVRDQLGNPTTYEYDARGNVVTRIDAAGGASRRTFDANDNLLTETDPLGHVTRYAYDAKGNVSSRTDPLGRVTRYTYDTLNQVRTTTNPLGYTTRNEHDSAGNLRSITDELGNVTRFTGDSRGNPTTLDQPDGGVTRFQYDGQGRPTTLTDALGTVTTYTYDASGNPLTESITRTTPAGVRTLVTTRAYDAENRLVRFTDAEGNVARVEYDAAGNRTATVDPLGRRTEFRYDSQGRVNETIYPDATPGTLADNPRFRIEYDAAGRETARIDEAGRRTEYRYDALGRLIETVFPDATPANLADNPRTRTEYDLAGRVTAHIDERGQRTEYQYDAAGQRTLVRDPLGHATTTAYDAAGRVEAVTDPLGRTTRYTYDAAGRLVATRHPDGTATLTTVDAQGRPRTVTDPLLRTTRLEYDALGRLTAVVDALNQRTEYGYDEAGNLVSQKDANGHVTRYEYDGISRPVATTLPLGQRSTTAYDAAGNVVREVDFNGDAVRLDYDARDRLVAKHYPDATTLSFTYTPTGQRATATDARGTTSWTYDARDRLLSRVEPDGMAIHSTYDAAGNRTTQTTAAGTTGFSYDPLGRLATVTDADGDATRYTYDAAGNLVRTDFANGLAETRSYDALNRLLAIETTGPAGLLAAARYTLDQAGRRLAVEDQANRRVDYTYDPLDRLTREAVTDAVFGGHTIDYTYDPVGNRLTRDDSAAGLTQYTYDANDRLLTEALAGQAALYAYDANGNTLSRLAGAADRVFYEWDFENRLVGIDTNGDGATDIHNTYDADGLRVRQTLGASETRYLLDTVPADAQVALEYTPSGLVLASYVHGNDLISQEAAGQKSVYLVDGLGSTVALANALGAVTDRYVYDAFGRLLRQNGSTPNAYLFAGEQRDAMARLDYLRARYLDVRSGRFLSRDPHPGTLRAPVTLHDYLYAAASPTHFVDPSGKFFTLSGLMSSLRTYASLAISAVVSVGRAVLSTGVNFVRMVALRFVSLLQSASTQFMARLHGGLIRIHSAATGGWRFRMFNLAGQPGRPTFRLLEWRNILRVELHPIRASWPSWLMYPHFHIIPLGAISHWHLPILEPIIIGFGLYKLISEMGWFGDE